MTCQHCQTWNLDEDHRCRRCGRRLKSTPGRISPQTYPIAATATAHAYDFSAQAEPVIEDASAAAVALEPGQQSLFSTPVNEPRVIAFDTLASPAAREAIRARAAEISRPAPVKTAKVEVSPRQSKANRRTRTNADQQRLDFFGQPEILNQPQSNIICDAPVGAVVLRIQAAMIDGACMVAGVLAAWAVLRLAGVSFALDKHSLLFIGPVLASIPLVYKLIWCYAGQDSIGTTLSGLRIVDFDGNLPSRERRFHRAVGSVISLAAAGVGLIWAFVDEDGLTWHDHMSGTFPTFSSEA